MPIHEELTTFLKPLRSKDFKNNLVLAFIEFSYGCGARDAGFPESRFLQQQAHRGAG